VIEASRRPAESIETVGARMLETAVWKEGPNACRRDVYHVSAPEIGDTFEITVIAPPGAPGTAKSFHALYVLDPSALLDIVVGTKHLFDIFSGGELPLTYVVGIGYADADVSGRRVRDFTPSKAEAPAGVYRQAPLDSGGAPRFLDYLRGEIIPHLEKIYPLDPQERVLIGYSMSGLFATYAMLSRPEAFNRYAIVSPSLWWDDGYIFRVEGQRAKSSADLPARVMLIGGSAEEELGGGWRNLGVPDEIGLKSKQVTNLQRLTSTLSNRRYPSLRLRTALIPEERHTTGAPAAIALALHQLFIL
jgi:uncharacterized protein